MTAHLRFDLRRFTCRIPPSAFRILLVLASLGVLCRWSLLPACAADAYQSAYEEALRTRRPIVLQYGASWCPSCRECDRLYGTAMAGRGVHVHLDVDRDRALILKYHLPEPIGPLPRVYYWGRDVHGGWTPARIFVGLPGIAVFLEK